MLGRCAVVAADTVPGVRNLSREFIEFYGDDDHAWSDVLPLSRVIATGKGRPADADLTLFKAMGMGISDSVGGVEVLGRARANGVDGHWLRRSGPSRVWVRKKCVAPSPAYH